MYFQFCTAVAYMLNLADRVADVTDQTPTDRQEVK